MYSDVPLTFLTKPHVNIPSRSETSTPWAQPAYHGGRPGDARTVLMCICEWSTIQFSVRVHLRITTVPLPSIASLPSAPTGWLVG